MLEIKSGFAFRHRVKRRRRTPWGFKDASSGTVDFEVSKAYGAASTAALHGQRKRRRTEEQSPDSTPLLFIEREVVGRAVYGEPLLGGTSDGWWQ
jgi:hypothetical protein